MGFPRRGCSTCKKRRIGVGRWLCHRKDRDLMQIQCDSARPTCGRCQKASRDCVWDPNEGVGWRFESENAFAGGQPRRPRAAKRARDELEDLAVQRAPDLRLNLSTPIHEQAVNYWVRNFTLRSDELPDIGHDYSVHVISYLQASQRDSSLSLALAACSHAIFGRVRRTEKAFEEAENFYAQSIIKTQEQIKKRFSDDSLNELLITIMLMASYENTMYDRRRRQSSSSTDFSANEVGSRIWKTVCHHKGASLVMNLGQKLDRAPDIALHRAIRRQVIRTCTLRGRHVPPWVEDGTQYGETGHMLELDSLMIRVVALRELSMPLFHDKYPDVSAWVHFLKGVLAEAQHLDLKLSAWAQASIEEWNYSTSPYTPDSKPVGTDAYRPSVIHTYASYAHATVWDHYRAVRLIVNSIRVRAYSHLLDCPTQCSAIIGLQILCQENIDRLSEDLCSSISYFFRDPGSKGSPQTEQDDNAGTGIVPKFAELLAWPLTVAVSTDSVPALQRDWAKNTLRLCAVASANTVLQSVIDQGEYRF